MFFSIMKVNGFIQVCGWPFFRKHIIKAPCCGESHRNEELRELIFPQLRLRLIGKLRVLHCHLSVFPLVAQTLLG